MQTLLEQALSQRLMEEFNQNIQLRMQLIEMQAKLKELEDVTGTNGVAQRSDKRAGNSGSKSPVGQEGRPEN